MIKITALPPPLEDLALQFCGRRAGLCVGRAGFSGGHGKEWGASVHVRKTACWLCTVAGCGFSCMVSGIPGADQHCSAGSCGTWSNKEDDVCGFWYPWSRGTLSQLVQGSRKVRFIWEEQRSGTAESP